MKRQVGHQGAQTSTTSGRRAFASVRARSLRRLDDRPRGLRGAPATAQTCVAGGRQVAAAGDTAPRQLPEQAAAAASAAGARRSGAAGEAPRAAPRRPARRRSASAKARA